MKKKLLLIVSMALFLFGCTEVKGINIDKPMQSAEFLNEELGLNEEIKETTGEYLKSIRNVIEIGDDTTILLNDDGVIEQININQLSREKVQETLKLIEFPDSSVINEVLSQTADTVTFDNFDSFTDYEGVGVSVTHMGAFDFNDHDTK